MIDELHIAGLGVIEEAALRLSEGLTVVTGETGAGKTMVVTALGLLLGDRADSSLVRHGADAATAEARFVPAPPGSGEWGAEDGELVVFREIPADGRSRARINGRLAPISALGELLGNEVEIHGQDEHARLSRPQVQRQLLDRYAGDAHARTLTAYRDAHARWREVGQKLARLEDDARERARTMDRLRHELSEIEAVGLDVETDATLDERLAVLEHAEELQLAAAEAVEALTSEGAAQDAVGVAVTVLRRSSGRDDDLDVLRRRAEGLMAELTDLAAELRHYGEALDAEPEHLAELRERQRVIAGLTRKYGNDVAEVLAYEERAAEELRSLEAEESESDGLENEAALLASDVRRLGADLHRSRLVAAERLAEAVNEHLADLAMPHARFEVAIEHSDDLDAFGATGGDTVTFLLAANPGEPARPVGQAASGGERSRVALAVEVALADVNDARVLIFDEVDAGIGGATAMAVGQKLARLAVGRQVLCVTHLAQLAAFADVQHVVEKGLRDGRTVTTTREVAAEARVAELSRMLSGDPDRETALRHARELLEEATARRVS